MRIVKHTVLALLIGVALGVVLCHALLHGDPIVQRITTERIVIPGFRDSIVTDTLPVVVRYPVAVEDTTRLASMISERDALRRSLDSAGVRVSFGLDTTTSNGDRYMVECDELRRRVSFVATIAPRDTSYLDTTAIVTVQDRSQWSIGAGIGGSISFDGVLRPSVSISIYYNLLGL